MGTTELVVIIFSVGYGSLWLWASWLVRELRRERAAHAETRLHFRRQATAEWAKKMPRTGKIAVDPLCPKDVVYIINPETYRGPPLDRSAR